jgi:predicted dienelactone hydrolase
MNVRHDRLRAYDPFEGGPFATGSATIEIRDDVRDRLYTCEIWYPAAAPGAHPLIIFSHGTAPGGRRMASTLCAHLAGHGYVVAALDHAETFAPELAPQPGDDAERSRARIAGCIANRVPDVRLLLDALLDGAPRVRDLTLDRERIGIAGYSFGGWTALAATGADRRIRSVAALAPAGSSRPKPGIIPATLDFAWDRPVPLLLLAAAADTMTPLDGIVELFERAPTPKTLAVLERADHLHFIDGVATGHEALRNMRLGGDIAWIPAAMRPFSELCSEADASAFVCGLVTLHFDRSLRELPEAAAFAPTVQAALTARGIEAVVTQTG